MRLLKPFLGVVLVLGSVASVSAHADTLNFSFSAFGATASFSLPSSPTPDVVVPNLFRIDNVSIDVNGSTFVTDIDFFTSAVGGGAGSGASRMDGDQLFTGTLTDPTFKIGDFFLSGFITPDPTEGTLVPASGTLHISPAVAATPEPSSLLMLGTGALGVVGMVRRRFLAA